MKIIAGILALPFVLLGLALLGDSVLRRRLSQDARIVKERNNPASPAGRVFALLPAAQVETEILTRWTSGLFAPHGDVMVFDGAPKRFNASQLCQLVIKSVAGHRHIVLVVHSFSLMLAYDIAKALRESGDTRPISVLILDGLSHKRFVAGGQWLWLAKLLPAGPILNRLSRLVWKFGFKPNDPSTIRPNNLDNLHALHESYRSCPLSLYTDQLRYIEQHPPLEPLENVHCAWVISRQDELVNGAYEDCLRRGIFAEDDFYFVDEAGHLALHDWPGPYAVAIIKALRSLGIAA